jgi:hypothetical protein
LRLIYWMRIRLSIRWLLFLLLTAAGGTQAGTVEAKAPPPTYYYVQLIRGTDQDRVQEALWKPIGPKLSSRLSPVFRWKNYWEVHREAIPVQAKKVRRYRLSDVREVEIQLINPAEIEIRLYLKGKLMEKSRQLVRTHMGIIGGDRIGDESWFVVVRRDRPQ